MFFNDPNDNNSQEGYDTPNANFNLNANTSGNDNSILIDAQNVPLGTGGFDKLVIFGNHIQLLPKRLKNNPVPLDKTLPANDPRQRYDDSTTIDGWINVVQKLMHAAWEDDTGKFPITFTQDYALLPADPQNLNEVVIVYHQVSKIPATLGSHKEIKPSVREVRYRRTVDPADQLASGVDYIWGQTFEVIMAFTTYAKDWATMHKWYQKLESFMATYTFYWIQTGLVQFLYHEQTSDGLFDPPRNEEFPNRTVYYKIRIEQQTRVPYAEIEQVLLKAGVINPSTGVSTNAVIVTVDGVPESPILPGQNGLS